MRFEANTKLTVFVALFLPLLIALGFWQLDRAHDKQAIGEVQDAAASRPPQTLDTRDDVAPGHLARVRIGGRLDVERLVLLDNRTHEGRVGYEVFALLDQGEEAPALLLGFGWVPAPQLREDLPVPRLPSGPVSLLGVVVRDADQAPVFGEVMESDIWPLRVQRLDLAQIAEVLDRPVYAWPVMVAAGEPGVQTHVFEPVRMSANTHFGYAVQWFGLATVLVLGWLAASIRKPTARAGQA